jgi:hypothetical protein
MPIDDEVAISHLQRRKIEGRVLIPFIQSLIERIGRESALEILDATIDKLAIQDGDNWQAHFGNDLGSLRRVAQEVWGGGGSLEVDILDASDAHLSFNVTRCRYAEFYRELGLTDLGFHIHCKRDYAMIDGFNSEIELDRRQTLMEGADHCNFRYRKRSG